MQVNIPLIAHKAKLMENTQHNKIKVWAQTHIQTEKIYRYSKKIELQFTHFFLCFHDEVEILLIQ